MSEEGIAAGAPAPAHETPEQVIGELFAVAKLKEDGFRAEISPSDIRSWAERFKEALFRDRDEIVDATLAKRGPLLNCEVYRTDAKALRAYRRLAPMGPTYNEWLFRPSNPSRRPFARVCDLPAGEIFSALKQRRNIDATFTTRLIVDCLLSPASDDPGDVAQRNVDDVKFFIRSAVSLIRAHYDHYERSFHEVADRIAKRLEEIGMGDLASFVRAQTGDEPSWVPMERKPRSAAPGNAAAMREALERCNELFRCDDDDKSRLCHLARKADEATQAALAAPARNCDRFATAEEAQTAFLCDVRTTEGLDHLVRLTEIVGRVCDWLFDKAKGKETDNG